MKDWNKARDIINEALRVRDWHIWFAWFPVKTDEGIWIWRRKVWRKRYCLFGNWTNEYMSVREYMIYKMKG
jgi:hypothetical protein